MGRASSHSGTGPSAGFASRRRQRCCVASGVSRSARASAKPTDRLLDVGAGAGTITVDLAGIVAEVTATEIGSEGLELTRSTVAARGVTNIELRVADIHALPFDDATFDVTHAHQVLQHVADPVQALREMARVTRPGGIVAVRDSDYGGFTWWPRIARLNTWLDLYRSIAFANGGEPDAGRRLLSWAHAAGLRDVVATSSTWCYADPVSRAWWGGMWADRMVDSAIAQQITTSGRATQEDLRSLRDAWREWASDEDGWFSVPHGEIICRVR
ncbi:class I SAM-dependent methyltransferase [Microbacterium sp. CJ77]|uniref:class I SAM-dependent methyltransferase n=1 Tax=unclassified Microbacterium TaxID=2609290 RepID=UPI0035BC15AD